ncbi:MAG TPA: MotA/TolQ/ExbB proton channel family protein [Terriglobales bacterium]|nr:MotA/TolQ/ExbB proton channel family protein [Terriglobales bacterium]
MALVAFVLQVGGVRASVPALVASSGLFAKFILVLLLGVSVYTWAIIVERLRLYLRVQREDREFLAAFRAGATANPGVERTNASVLAFLARTGERALGTPPHASATSPASAPAPASRYELAQRAMERAAGDELARLERHVGFLATAGSVSPFIGLMGTVWGVMSAFLSIGAQGSASLVVVAPGIAEALITTVAGLAAAIPAVVGYNHLLARLRVITNVSSAFVTEFLDRRAGGVPA